MDNLFKLDVEVVQTNAEARAGIGTLGVYCFTTSQGTTCSSSAGTHSCMTASTRCTGSNVGPCGIRPNSLKN